MYIIRELLATKTPFLVIDENEEHIRHVEEETEAFPYIIGDASDDNVLLEARIQHARGLIASLPEDKDNLLVVVTARQLSQKLRIISRGIDPTIADKLKRAGADAVVSSNFIGGMRMVSEMIRPNVVEFLDLMLKDKDKNLRVEEVPINASSPCADNTLEQCNVRKSSNVLVVAAKDVEGNYIHNPESDFILHEGSALIVLGPVEEVNKLRSALKCV